MALPTSWNQAEERSTHRSSRQRAFGRRAFNGILVGALLSTGLASCGGAGESGAGSKNEVEFWTMQLQPNFTDYFNELIGEYETNNPGVTINWVDVPWEAMETKILSAVTAGQAPDVVNLNPNFASQLASRDAWLNLNEKLSEEQRQVYLPNIWQASSIGEVSFGLPWYLTTRVSIINQDLLSQAGVEEAPKTFAELATAAEAVKEKAGKYAFFTTAVADDSAELLESMVQMGVELVDEQGKAAFNSPAGKAAFQYWVELYQNELLPREVLTQGHRQAIQLYQSGDTAVLASGPEFLKNIVTNAPTVAEASAASSQITGTTGKKNVAVMNLVIPKSSDNPDSALDFALFVTNSENQLAFAKAANVLPSTVESLQAYQTELENKGEAASPVEQARAVSARQMNEAEVLVPAMEDLDKLQTAIYSNLQAAMLGDKTVDEAIADAASDWDER